MFRHSLSEALGNSEIVRRILLLAVKTAGNGTSGSSFAREVAAIFSMFNKKKMLFFLARKNKAINF